MPKEDLKSLVDEIFMMYRLAHHLGNRIFGRNQPHPFLRTSLFREIRASRKSISDLARLICVSRQSMRNMVCSWVESDLVELQPSLDDDRALTVILTEAGLRSLEEVETYQDEFLRRISPGFEREAVQGAVHVIRKLRKLTLWSYGPAGPGAGRTGLGR